MAERKFGSPYFRYDNPRDQGRVGVTPKGKWFQDYYDPETRTHREEEILKENAE